MREATYQTDGDNLLKLLFKSFVKDGLENITIRDLCKSTGIAQGTLYYWFGDKANLICEVTEYGLENVIDELFKYVFSNMYDLKKFFDNFLYELDKYKNEFRFIYQMAASPVYGDLIRAKSSDINLIYDKYTKKLARELGCDEKCLQPIVYLFISAVLDYVIWDEREKSQLQLEFIYSSFLEITKFDKK